MPVAVNRAKRGCRYHDTKHVRSVVAAGLKLVLQNADYGEGQIIDQQLPTNGVGRAVELDCDGIAEECNSSPLLNIAIIDESPARRRQHRAQLLVVRERTFHKDRGLETG